MVDRTVKPLGIIQALLGLVAALGLLTFVIREPKPVGWVLRLVSVVSATAYLKIDSERKAIESGQRQLDRINAGWDELRLAQEQFEINCNIEIQNVQNQFSTRYLEIEQEYQLVEMEKQAISAAWNELRGTFETERAAIALEKEQQERALVEAKQQQETALAEAIQLQQQQIDGEWNRLREIGTQLTAKAVTQDTLLQKQAEEHAAEIARVKAQLAERERMVSIAEANLKLRAEQLETEYTTKLIEAKNAIVKGHNTRLQELQHEQEKVLVSQGLLEDEFNRRSLELQNALQEARNELRAAQATYEKQEQEHQDRVAQIYAEREQEFAQFRDATVQQLTSEWNVQAEQANSYISTLMIEIDSLRCQLAEFLIAATFPDHKGYAAYIGNKVLQEIRSFDGCVVEPHDCLLLPGGDQNNPSVVLWLRQGEGVRPEQLFALKGAIATRVNRTDITMQIDAQGFIAIGFGNVEGAITRPAGDAAVVDEKNERKAVCKTEPTEQQLADAFDHSSMYAVLGPTGAGKSSLVNNLLSRASASLGGAEIIIADPKFPDPDTLWSIRGQEVIPKYCDIENDEILMAVEDMAAGFLARKRRRLQDVKAKRAISRYKRLLWVFDEVPTSADMYSKSFTMPLKMGVRVARGLDGKIVIIGQTPRCSDYGFKIPDMLNFTRLYLGAEFAVLGLKEITCSPRVKSRIMAEIYFRQQLAEEQIARGELLPNGKPSEMYFALVATQSGQVFLMSMPAPNAWADWQVAEIDHDIVPEEELVPVSKDDLKMLMEQARKQEEEEEAAAAATPTAPTDPAIDLSKMSPLQQAITTFCLRNRGEQFCFSDFNAKDATIRQIVDQIARDLTAADRTNQMKTRAQTGKVKTKTPTITKAGIVKDACLDLITTHKVGSMATNGKRFGIL